MSKQPIRFGSNFNQKLEYVEAFKRNRKAVQHFMVWMAQPAEDRKPKTIYEAIAARSFPMTKVEIKCLLKTLTDKWPSGSEVLLCRPDLEDKRQ